MGRTPAWGAASSIRAQYMAKVPVPRQAQPPSTGEWDAETQAYMAEKAGIIRTIKATVESGFIEMGRHLDEARAYLKHKNYKEGGWVRWLETNFDWSERQAYNLIDVYDTFGKNVLQAPAKHLPPFTQLVSLASVKDEDTRQQLTQQAVEEKLTSRQVEELVKKAKAEAKAEAKAGEDERITEALTKAEQALAKELQESKARVERAMLAVKKANEDIAAVKLDAANKQQAAIATIDTKLKAAEKELATIKKNGQNKSNQAYIDKIAQLEASVDNLINERATLRNRLSHKGPPEFGTQINAVTNLLTLYLQNDDIVSKLHELVHAKEDITLESDIVCLERLIQELVALSQRSQLWTTRLTPTNDRWAYRQQ
jgi:chemotaxis protein histidine kinase CheA